MSTFKLCCGGRGCPSITRNEDNTFVIKDDIGGSVLLLEEELLELLELVPSLIKD